MQDGKSLQAGTPFLAQNFAKAFDVKFTTKEGKRSMFGQLRGVSTFSAH